MRYTTPEMKLFAWLCIAWRPPVSSTLTHISLSDQPSRSPNSSAPNSGSSGVIDGGGFDEQRADRSGCSIAVCTRFGEELFAVSACALKCSTRPSHQIGARAAPRHAHERRGKESDDFVHDGSRFGGGGANDSTERELRQIRDGARDARVTQTSQGHSQAVTCSHSRL